ncbi:MAG: DUF6391 domain-containing protein [Dehalococcoidia bacterium]
MFPLTLLRNWLDDVRRNHGLEHATVAVLFARQAPQRLAGRASGNGFFILGKVDRDVIESCAHEALSRLKRGESGLVVSPMCGTNLVVTGGVCALATMVSLTLSREKKPQERLGDAISASTMGALAAQPLGRLVQEKITTMADHGDTEIVRVRQFTPWLLKVYTRRG